MVIPSLIKQLNKTHSAFDQTSGEQAVVGEARFAGFCAIHLMNLGRFIVNVHQLGHGGLHPIRHLVLADSSRDFRVTNVIQTQCVEIFDGIDNLSTVRRLHALGVG